MQNIDKQKSEQNKKLLAEHSQIHSILTHLHSVASLAPRVVLSNHIGNTVTRIEYPVSLCMKLAREAVRIAEERMHEIESEVWPDTQTGCKGGDVCEDNRFEMIKFFKARLVDATNIATSQDEMRVIDSILFRFWQLGWLHVLLEHEMKKDCNDLTKALQNKLLTTKYSNILAGQVDIYTNPKAMDALEAVVNALSDLGWLDILEKHQPKEEKAKG